jgi:predicted O-linked N-acetylglucosamine transferase (SPINDLY family)
VISSNVGDAMAAKDELVGAITADPEFLPAYVNLGGVLDRLGARAPAVEQWNAVLTRLSPLTGVNLQYKIAALKQIARIHTDQHEHDAAEAVMAQLLDLDPKQRDVLEQYVAMRLAQCKWPIAEPREGLSAKDIVASMHPLSLAIYTDDPMLQLAGTADYVAKSVAEVPSPTSDRRHAPVETKTRRLRVGYVSSDLRDHAVGYLMAELFELHDRSKIEVFAYYCGIKAPDGLQVRLKSAIEHWREIRDLSDEEAAAMIAADGIDILVDVNGHTRDSRTSVFAKRPAPIQVNWLGFPGSMGTPYHHYVVSDPWITPPEAEIYFTEKVLRLPCYQPNDRKRAVQPTPTRAEAGLPENAFVFCCFNGSQKISRHTFSRWLEILKRTPGSVLWLLDSSPGTNERLIGYAEAAGIERSRMVFGGKLANPWHLARYPLADLFLDTAPYGAHTTASDALWMGVPMVTISGKSFASRVCGSLVRSAGLPELVCATEAEYVDLAVALANDPARVAELKARLKATRDTCDLFNMDLLTRSLEDLYAEMAADYQAGRLPQPDLTNFEAYHKVGAELDHESADPMFTPGYPDLYRQGLRLRHLVRPLRPDARLWAGEEPVQSSETETAPLRRRA